MSAALFQSPRLKVPDTRPPPVPDLADRLLRQMQQFQPMRPSRRESFLGDPPQHEQRRQRTLLGGR